MSAVADNPSHARLMDSVYRHQRHIYDLTRKFYLLGRDDLIDGLVVPRGGSPPAAIPKRCSTVSTSRR